MFTAPYHLMAIYTQRVVDLSLIRRIVDLCFDLNSLAASQCAYLYYALKVCTLLVRKKYTLLSV